MARAQAFWESIITGPDSTLRDRMYAEEKLEWLEGVRPAGTQPGATPGAAMPKPQVVFYLPSNGRNDPALVEGEVLQQLPNGQQALPAPAEPEDNGSGV
jgi:hypothetical protein